MLEEVPTLSHQPQVKELNEVMGRGEPSLNEKLYEQKTELGEKLKDEPLKDIKKAIRDKTSLARMVTEPEKQLAIQSELNALQRQLKLKRAHLFRLEDEIEEMRDRLIEQIEKSLNQKVQEEDLFTIHWTIK